MSILGRMRAWANGVQYEEPQPEEESPREGHRSPGGGLFSTDLPFPRDSLSKWIQENSRLQTPEFTAVQDANFQGMAMDQALEAYGMDSTTLKSGFSASNQQLPEVLFAWYVSQGFIGYQACAIISQNWLVNKALMIPGEDAIRNGYTVARNDGEPMTPELMEAIKQADKKYHVNDNLKEFSTNKRRFGIRVALFVVESDDKDYYRKPFNIDGVKPGSYKGISQIDPSWMSPVLDAQAVANPASIDFYEPTWWQINGTMYHKSHLAVVRYIDVPDVLKSSYQYGGLPLTQLIMERVYAAERTANEAPMLAETKRLTTINTDIAAIQADPGRFEKNLAALTHYRNNYGVFVQGLEESMNQFDTALTDLDDVIMSQYQLVAAVANVPATKLLGTSPKGFNATGEYEQESYHDLLESEQTDMDLMLDKHHTLVIKSEIAPDAGVEPFTVNTIWEPVDSPNAKEQSEINMNESATDVNLVSAGAITGLDVRNRIIEAPKSGYNGLEKITDEDLEEEDLFTVDGGVFGFVSVVPDRVAAKQLYDWAYDAGISLGLQPERMHITLAHDKTGIPEYQADSSSYTVKLTGEIDYLGEGVDRGLVLFLESTELRARHDAIKAMGAECKYDSYQPHITLKYDPAEGDLELARAVLDKLTIDEFTVGREAITLLK